MKVHADSLEPLVLDEELVAAARARLTSPEAVAQRDRARRAAGMLPTADDRYRAIREIADAVARLPVLDDRSPDEILGYDDDGLPT